MPCLQRLQMLTMCTTLFVLAAASGSNAFAQTWEQKYDGVWFASDVDRVYAVRIDIDLIGVSIFPKVSVKGEPAPPKKWAEKHGLEVAINANFFSMSTMQDPIGMAIADGVNWGGSNNNRYAQIGFTKDHRLKWLEQASTEGPLPWMYNVVAGSPEIVRGGEVISGLHSSSACSGLGHCANTRSRSGIGVDATGKYLYLVTSKGDTSSTGNTVNAFAQTMVKLGAHYAINLDGGGSAAIYIAGTKYGTNNSRTVAVNLGFDVNPKPQYVCKKAEIDNPGAIFYDMEADHWGESAVQALKNHDITQGCGGEANRPLFCPNCGTTRAQAAIFIARALKLELSTPDTPTFSDVQPGDEAFEAIETLAAHDLIAKTPEFRPQDIASRAEAAAFLAKAFIPHAADYAQAPTPTFTDVPPDHWAYPYVEAMARQCFVFGTNDAAFHPDQPTTRVEFAAMLARAAGLISETCTYPKSCQTWHETQCIDKDIQTCIAYEWVKSTCPDDQQCFHNICAQCDINESPTCVDQTRKFCQDGTYKIEDCTASQKICELGQCIFEKQCDPQSQPTCENDTTRLTCDENGQWLTAACPQNQKCTNGKCHEVNAPPISPTIILMPTDCSQTQRRSPFPWLTACLTLGIAGLLRRRTQSKS